MGGGGDRPGLKLNGIRLRPAPTGRAQPWYRRLPRTRRRSCGASTSLGGTRFEATPERSERGSASDRDVGWMSPPPVRSVASAQGRGGAP